VSHLCINNTRNKTIHTHKIMLNNTQHQSYGTINECEEYTTTTSNISVKSKISSIAWRIFTSTPVIHLLLITLQVLYAGFGIIGHIATQHIHPIIFASFRIGLVSITLVPLSLIIDFPYWRQKVDDSRSCGCKLIPEWNDGLTLIILGALLCYNVCSYVAAVSLTPYTIISILQPATTGVVCVLSVLLRKERGTLLKFMGVFFAVAGSVTTLIIITFYSNNSSDPSSSFEFKEIVGTCIYISHIFTTACYIVLQKTVLNRGVCIYLLLSFINCSF
jgi:drug/metabolite transporter (DMT)-like permease